MGAGTHDYLKKSIDQWTHDGRWFARIDVWFFGIRITKNVE